MCGLAGFISQSNDYLPDASSVKKMIDIGANRGPDFSDLFVEGNVVLAHARLSIIDLDDAANQPMTIDSHTLIFNVEIYNYKEIRAELISLGIRFDTQSDTEVVLRAYIFWGQVALRKFNGMWAFAIYSSDDNKIFFSRDRFGEKPLYFYTSDDGLYFASEIRQLLEVVERPKVNKDVALTYLLGGIENYSSETFFEGIQSLEAGTNITFTVDSGFEPADRYYDLETEIKLKTNSSAANRESFEDLFEDSVRLRLRSDVDMGICLSGGIDSTAISVAAGKILGVKSDELLSAIHMSSFEAKYDESMFAEEVSKISGLALEVMTPASFDLFDQVDEIVRCQGEPFGGPSMLMGMNLYRLARERVESNALWSRCG